MDGIAVVVMAVLAFFAGWVNGYGRGWDHRGRK